MGIATVITSGKGGVGKSTLAVGLGRALAQRGRRVLLVDCDAGLRSLDRMTGTEENLVFDIADVVFARCSPAEAIYPCGGAEGLFLLPAPSLGEDEKAGTPFKTLLRPRAAGLPRGSGRRVPLGGSRRGQGLGGLQSRPRVRSGGRHGPGAVRAAGGAPGPAGHQPVSREAVPADRGLWGLGRRHRRGGHPPAGRGAGGLFPRSCGARARRRIPPG